MPLYYRKNFADRPGMQPRRLINVDMPDLRVPAHVDIGERAVKARPRTHVGVFPLGQIHQAPNVRGVENDPVPSNGTTNATGIFFRLR